MMLPCSVSLILTGEPYRGLHGLFPVAPFVILWPLALRDAWRRHDARVLALGTATGAYLLLCFGALALTYIHKGQLDVGMQWGQRYLLTAYPMLVVLSLLALRALQRSSPSAWPRAAVAGLFALLVAAGVGLEARGLRMLHGTRSILMATVGRGHARGRPDRHDRLVDRTGGGRSLPHPRDVLHLAAGRRALGRAGAATGRHQLHVGAYGADHRRGAQRARAYSAIRTEPA